MADVGITPPELVRKKNEVEIRRLEHQLSQHELEKMEILERVKKIDDNIKACEKEIAAKQRNIDALGNDS